VISAVSVIATIVFVALVVFFVLMWLRFILDWTRAMRPGWRPRGAALLVAEADYVVTDPPIKLVRRIVPPIRLVGGIRIELSWSIVMIVCLVLIWVAGALR